MKMLTSRPRTVTREELYKLVWEIPMVRLAEEFGVSGNGLAKACRRLSVPYPSRGYWAKKEAGKPVSITKLPRARKDTLEATEIRPTPAPAPLPAPLPPDPVAVAAAALVADVRLPTVDLHPLVQEWIDQHKRRQKDEARENKRLEFPIFGILADLTERDLYRFRATSAIFTGVEKAGGKVGRAPVDGKIIFLASGHEVECTIVEKMEQSLKPWATRRDWTAYPGHHGSHLASTGFLRISIKTWLAGRKPQWIERDSAMITDLLPEIVGEIIAAGPTLERLKLEREERDRQFREEEAQRQAVRLQREIDDKRWGRFRDYAARWEERDRLVRMIAEIEARAEDDGARMSVVGDRTVAEWIAWAKDRVDQLDPLRNGPVGLFSTLSKMTAWSQ